MTTIKLGNKCDSLRIVKTENTVTPIPRPIAMFEAIPQPEPERFTVEVIAHFPGGQERFKEFVKDQMVTPARCVEEEIDGMVAVQFDINERGRVDSIVFLSECKACPEYSQEILRVLKSSPMWYPAQKNGRIIRSTKTLKFKIHNED